MKEDALFIYDEMPKPMKKYLSNFGWHFNKAACMDAVSAMWRKDNNGKKIRIKVLEKDQVDEMLKKHNVDLENKNLYDYVYVYHMVMADFTGISVDDEKHVALTVKAIVDDPDKPGGNVFLHWYWDKIYAGRGVEFDDYMNSDD